LALANPQPHDFDSPFPGFGIVLYRFETKPPHLLTTVFNLLGISSDKSVLLECEIKKSVNLFFTPHREAGTLADESSTPEMLAVETKHREVGKKYMCWDVTVCCTQPSWHTLHSMHQLEGDQHLSQKHLRCLLSFWRRQ